MTDKTPRADTWTCEWCGKVHHAGEDYLLHQKECDKCPYHDVPRTRDWDGDFESLSIQLERELSASKAATAAAVRTCVEICVRIDAGKGDDILSEYANCAHDCGVAIRAAFPAIFKEKK